ncbi:MAG: peptidylprolyl isomerase [Bacilli bacterium]|nr:peptidylprolyl isomerase [Bacilli bacterium]
MKKKLLICLAVLGLTSGCGKVSTLPNGDDALVSFSNTNLGISAGDLYSEVKGTALSKLIDMIDTKILLDKYPDKSSDADKYVSEQYDLIKTNFKDDKGKFDEESLKEQIYAYYGITDIDKFKDIIRLNYYRTEAVNDYAKKSVTDKQIQKYYDENVYGDISCKHILITPAVTDDMSDEDKTKADKEALQKAKDIIKKLKNGESFDDLAKEYSDDTSNKDKGGDLGYFNTGDMLEEFEKAAFDLKKGKYTTTPVKTKYGYHIILKTDEKEKPSLEDKKEEIINTLASEAKSNDTALSINALVELRKEYGMNIEDDEMSKLYSTYISNSLLSAKSNSSK